MSKVEKHLPRLLPWLVTLLLIVFLVQRGGDWRGLWMALGRAKWAWLLLALLFQAASYGAVAWLNELLLRRYGAFVPWFKQYVIQLAMAFVEAALPSATVSGFMLRARLLKSHGVTPDVATLTAIVEIVLITSSVLLLALVVSGLAALGHASGLEMLAQPLTWILCGTVLAGMVVWLWQRNKSSRLGNQIGNWFDRTWDDHIVRRWPKWLSAWPAARLLARGHYLVGELISLLRTRPYTLAVLLVARTGLEALGFATCFYSLGLSLSPAKLLQIYTLTIGVNTLGAVPGGVGLAEVSLAALYTQFGVDPGHAVAVALIYRLTDYWLPRAIGGVAWLWLERQHRMRPDARNAWDTNRLHGTVCVLQSSHLVDGHTGMGDITEP